MCFNVKFAWFSLGNVSFFRISTHELQDVSISFLTTMWTVFRRCILGFFKHSDYCMIHVAVFVHHSICMLDIFQGIASFYSAIDLMQHKIAFSFSLYVGFFFSTLIFKNKFPFHTNLLVLSFSFGEEYLKFVNCIQNLWTTLVGSCQSRVNPVYAEMKINKKRKKNPTLLLIGFLSRCQPRKNSVFCLINKTCHFEHSFFPYSFIMNCVSFLAP